MLSFLRENWEVLSGLGAAVGAVVAYALNRSRELAWKRTEFLFDLSYRLDSDPVLAEAMQILEGRHRTVTLNKLFPLPPAAPDVALDQVRHRFDRLLNVFHRLAYSVLVVRTLSVHEVALFGWYLQQLSLHPGLRHYCKESGFYNVIELCKKAKLWKEGATAADLEGKPEVF